MVEYTPKDLKRLARVCYFEGLVAGRGSDSDAPQFQEDNEYLARLIAQLPSGLRQIYNAVLRNINDEIKKEGEELCRRVGEGLEKLAGDKGRSSQKVR